jgi:exodeoxyribonuclease-3
LSLRIVTWNINSLRLRLDNVARLAAALAPDVLCLQETKVQNDHFPLERLQALGYRDVLQHGMKSYNGVAVLSRVELAGQATLDWCERQDCRHATVRLPGGIELHNFYVPAGGDLPDPEANPKFAHKLRFLDEMTAWFAAERRPTDRLVLVGDLNIAPLEMDVWSHKQLLDVVSHTPVEVARMAALQKTIGWVDAVRHFVPPEERLYSWWSYRARDWAASNRGRRLDHIWVSPALRPALRQAQVLREARGWTQPSDHVPVMIEIG